MMNHANFQLNRAYSELFGKIYNWLQMYKQTSSTFCTSNIMFLQNIVLSTKNCWVVTTRTFYYKYLELHTFVNACKAAVLKKWVMKLRKINNL